MRRKFWKRRTGESKTVDWKEKTDLAQVRVRTNR